MYLLDTNHCSRIIQGESSVIAGLEQVGDLLVATCVVVAGELRFMAQKSTKKTENLSIINNFLKNITVYPVDNIVAEIYGDFKFNLYHQFGPKDRKKREQTEIHKLGFSENDLWIAAVAKRYDLIIVSADSDFGRMQEAVDVAVESWYHPS